jgi:DNA-binding IclR family transcriptional regulator
MRATALKNALKVIDLVERDNTIKFNELKESVDFSASTLSAILSELNEGGYLRKSENGYALGPRFLQIAGGILQRFDIREYAAEELERLRDKTGETTELAVPDDSSILFIDRREGTDSIRLFAKIGSAHNNLHAHALGKVMLAHMKQEKIRGYLNNHKLIKKNERTIVNKNELFKHLENVKKTRVATDIRENRDDLVRAASPVLNSENVLIGIIGIAAPAFRTDRKRIALFRECVRKSGETVSRAVGFKGNY